MKNITLKELPQNERPRERLLRYGPEALTNSELIAIILRTGSKDENVLSLSARIIKERGGLNGLLTSTKEDFTDLKGIGSAKASQLIAIAELSKRFRSYRSGENYKICSPRDAAEYVMEEMRYLKQEILKVIMLNTKNKVIYEKNVFLGSVNSSIVHPREIYKEAIIKNSTSIVIFHNHPSGDPTPSREDLNVTNRIQDSGRILGVDLLDHIIIGNGTYISLKEKGIL
ncbi:DNA repair protein RadC [Hathewaya histolytica]|uniref:DNA repair protein RadC n=1 Tax=Hathewaya histolytica TaxID=1498 RepID=A0A4U9RI26_HATHI|nr:DNA repair protein RadC [Hathewaya histolytica]VTQ90898.1 DNA repair protein RadC [Hathewaya histolytica]